MTVTIETMNIDVAGRVTETLPPGFTYVSSSSEVLNAVRTGQNVAFTLLGDETFTYTVTASAAGGSHSFPVP